jgi:hypothetical protein
MPWNRYRLHQLLDQMIEMSCGTVTYEVTLLSEIPDEADLGCYTDTRSCTFFFFMFRCVCPSNFRVWVRVRPYPFRDGIPTFIYRKEIHRPKEVPQLRLYLH